MGKRNFFLIAFIFIFAVSVSACDPEGTSPAFGLGLETVDLRFREFYEWLGGESVLGPAISPKFSHGGVEYQYTATVLMVYYPTAANGQRFQLAALGVELGMAEPPLNPDTPNGHDIYPDFLGKYAQMGGARYIGLPITEVRHNPERKRIEQYYENAGFYQLETDLTGEVFLIHYGSWKCADACGYSSPLESRVGTISMGDTPFATAVSRLDPSFTGYPLTEPYVAFDGMIEQIFENVVVADPNNPGGIRLRPILGMLGVSSSRSNYAVPSYFQEYLDHNSGLGLSGQPLSEYTNLSAGIERQCFTNLCLDFHAKAPDDLQVRPAPLGYSYKNMFYEKMAGEVPKNEITMRIWEQYPLLRPGQAQEIGVKISASNTSLKNFEPVLTLFVPGVGEIPYKFPPTNADGISNVSLKPIDIPIGTRIEYQVCVINRGERFCLADDFMLWE